MPTAPHPIQRRYHAERLTRRRRADEQKRYAASQRRGRIDPNPHQIDAVIFALRRIPEGGCILADEVGLGKTIEAGLVIAQLLAEGKRRILLIVPKPLLGQWQSELYTLFGMEAREAGADAESLAGAGVFLVGREMAGSVRGSRLLQAADPFDLCVIDEAHEIFAGIYKRYDRGGKYREDAEVATTAHRVRSFLGHTPVLLLTATPIQNSLTELWGLVQYVERTGTLLGDLKTFRKLFIAGDDRILAPGQADELKRRIATICQRTLRRQAQEFLERPFVNRRTQLFEYLMSPEEKALYDDVTAYLLEGDVCAFRGRQRRLLLIGFHRRMASSVRALAASLRKVADRLRSQLAGDDTAKLTAHDFALDLEDEDLEELPDEPGDDEAPPPDAARIQAELTRVEGFIEHAEALPGDSKARALLEAVRVIHERGAQGDGSGKVVIFTESLTTQDYLQELLLEDGLLPGDITLFRGSNDGPRVAEALELWQSEVGAAFPGDRRPSRHLAVRLALIHEFRTSSRVFISTEAGAKGLNLQFCDTLINYDLPWNPQRIEQRIGRCHRYSQKNDVTVVNFLAKDNEAQRLTFEILSRKLDLFGKVLDASDDVLYEPRTDAPEPLAAALGVEFFEKQLHRIYQSARTVDEIEEDLRELRQSLDERRHAFESQLQRTADLIESRFDEKVRQVFRRIQDDLPASLADLDGDLERLVTGYLDAIGVAYERRREETGEESRVRLKLPPSPRLPEGFQDGQVLVVGHARDLEDADPLHLGHPLVVAAIDEARRAATAPFVVRFPLTGSRVVPAAVAQRRGERGRLVVTKVTYLGFEEIDHLLVTALLEGDAAALEEADARALLELNPEEVLPFEPPLSITDDDVDDAVDESLFYDQAQVAEEEQARFEGMIEQIERHVDDRLLVERRQCKDIGQQLERARIRRDAAVGAAARTRAEAELQKLQAKLDECDEEIARLAARQDPEYEKWRTYAHERRYVAPVVERILDVEFVLG